MCLRGREESAKRISRVLSCSRRRSRTTSVDCEETTGTMKSNSRKCCCRMATADYYFEAILALCLLLGSCCHCLPLRSTEKRDVGPATEWWHIPCDTPKLNIQKQAVGSKELAQSLGATQLQLQLASLHFKNRKLREMYATVVDVLDREFNFHWLPRMQFESFKDFQNIKDLQDQGPKVLYDFDVALQKFAVTLNKLYHHKHSVTELGKFGTKRRQVLKELLEELKKVLCEVEKLRYAMDGVQPRELLSEKDVIPPGKWDDRSDITAMLPQDWGILKTYEVFLKDGTNIMDNLLKFAEQRGDGLKKKKLRTRGGKKNQKGTRRQRSGSQEAGKSNENNGEERRKNRRRNGERKRPEGVKRGRKERRRQEKTQQEQ